METIKKWLKRIGLLLIVILILIFVFLNSANYSKGFRAGVPMKVSNKGIIFKTNEGELNVGGLMESPEGAIPSVWAFTVSKSNPEVLDKLNEAITQSKRVKLYYHEKYIKFFWKGDTKYFVYDVEIL